MSDLLASLIVIFGVGVPLVFAFTRRGGPGARVIQASFAAHVLSSLAVVWMTTLVYRGGDMLTYQFEGVTLANAMRRDFWGMFPEVLRLIAQLDATLPIETMGGASSTGSMTGLVTLLAWLAGDSLYAECLIVALLGFAGKVLMFRALRPSFPSSFHTTVAVCVVLVPSVVFWSSGIAKEAFAVASMGPAFLGVRALMDGKWARGTVLAIIGCLGVAAVKPYILFALIGAGAVWIATQRAARTRGTAAVLIKPTYLLVGLGVAMVAFVLLGEVFPRFALDNLAEETARLQDVGARAGGGSYYEMGDATQRTLGGQLAFAPFAVVTALFRPFLFEANNVQAAVAALESTAFVLLFVRAVYRRGVATLTGVVLRSPTLLFCLAFVLVLGLPVGLSTTNMGTLSRYRMPLVPCLALLIVTASRVPRASRPRAPVASSRTELRLDSRVASQRSGVRG